MKEIKEILDKRADAVSSWEFVFVFVSILIVFVILPYILKDKIFYLLTWMKIKHIKIQIKKHSLLLKNHNDPKEVDKLNLLLSSLFEIYKTKIPRTISINRLFPLDERTIMGELDEYELKMKSRLTHYYVLSQNIERYYETGYSKNITLTELINKL